MTTAQSYARLAARCTDEGLIREYRDILYRQATAAIDAANTRGTTQDDTTIRHMLATVAYMDDRADIVRRERLAAMQYIAAITS